MPESDFSGSCISGYGSSPSRHGPSARKAYGRSRDLPVPTRGASVMPGSQTTPSSAGNRNIATADFAFRQVNHVGTRIYTVSRLNGWPIRSPTDASPDVLTDACARIRGDVDSYSFIALDFHHILLAGFSRRTHSHYGLHTRTVTPITYCCSRTRSLATSSGWIADAAFPHVLRTYVRTSAISASLRFQPKAGMAGAVGAAEVATARLPIRTTRIKDVASADWTKGALASRGKRVGTPPPL